MWLTDRGIATLGDCTTHVLGEYGLHLRDSGTARITAHGGLSSLTRLWVFDQLSGRPSGIGCPPWEMEGVDDYLPPATSGGENATEAIAEQTLGPLLIWAIRTVEEFSDDILTAWTERNRVRDLAAANVATPASRASLRTFMDRIDTDRLPIPRMDWPGRTTPAGACIAALAGASLNQVYNASRDRGWRQAALQRPGPCPLDVLVTGLLGDTAWREAIDYTEAAIPMRQLGTACFIVIAHLTGMRPRRGGRTAQRLLPRPGAGQHRAARTPLDHKHRVQDRPRRRRQPPLRGRNPRCSLGGHRPRRERHPRPGTQDSPRAAAVRPPRPRPARHPGRHRLPHRPHARNPGGGLRHVANYEATARGLVHEVIPPDPHGKIGT
ncbi:hypothetical protein ACFV23_18850 [Streptomyces sp. NPDC059627]